MSKFRNLVSIARNEGIATAYHKACIFLVHAVPNPAIILFYPFYSLLHPRMNFGFIMPLSEVYKVTGLRTGRSFYIPALTLPLVTMSNFWSGNSFETVENRIRKYMSSDLATLGDAQTVLDVGAFLGAFSIGVANDVDRVIAVEPDETNAECIRRNAYEMGVDNITIVNSPVYESETKLDFNVSGDPTDHSLGTPDSNPIGITRMQTTTIDSIAAEFEIEEIDFLKIDAEGMEPEAIKGANKVRIHSLAIDCGMERNGESTFHELHSLLTDRNYVLERRKTQGEDVLYGEL